MQLTASLLSHPRGHPVPTGQYLLLFFLFSRLRIGSKRRLVLVLLLLRNLVLADGSICTEVRRVPKLTHCASLGLSAPPRLGIRHQDAAVSILDSSLF